MFLTSQNLSQIPHLLHGFTDRELGDDYGRIAEEIGVPVEKIITLKQIHSDIVHVLDNPPPWMGGGGGEGGDQARQPNLEGDALITNQPGLVVGVRTADCVPLLVCDPVKKVVAAIHAGWKGILAGIIESTAYTMQKQFGSQTADWIVAIGPAICGKCFEVGPEVVEQFVQKFGRNPHIKKGAEDKSFVDTRGLSRRILTSLSVLSDNIETLPFCTVCDHDRFYSFRKGDEVRRNLSFIAL